jgi:phosphatidylserine/phosphatidylglycerophosphate/cardiolipin synthase-like enzyme
MELRQPLRNRSVRSVFAIVFVCSLLAAACEPAPATALSVQLPLQPGASMDGMEVFFTDPTAPSARNYKGGPDEALAAALDKARLSIDVAAYSLNLWSVRNALIRAKKRGVVVRMVMESDNMDVEEVQDLIGAGISIVGDQHEGLMHDKFIVIDRNEVWTGSMNYTVSGAYKDNNNLIVIHSTQVAEDYTTEFDEMFENSLFGPDIDAATPYSHLTLDDTPVEVYFSPDDGVAARLAELLQNAQESIYFMAYSFTSNDLGNIILMRSEAGVRVAGVMDAEQVRSNQGTEYDPFLQAGLAVRLDGNEGLMHHKVMIIDDTIVVTGSYNFTSSAENDNDENVVIVFSPELAAQYLLEFKKVYQQAQP